MPFSNSSDKRSGGEKEAGRKKPVNQEGRVAVERKPVSQEGRVAVERKKQEHKIDILERKLIDSVRNAEKRTRSQTEWPRIPKVPEILRGTENFKKFYEPRVISIGPYHHGKKDLKPGEMIKPLYAKKFLDDSGQDIEALYIKIKSKIKEVKDCYDSSATRKNTETELAWMMLLDGCFLLQFIRGKGMEKVLRKHQRCFVRVDSFLLENQLPFGVLKLILERANLTNESPMEEQIKNYVNDFIGRPKGSISKIQLEEVNEEPSHLLDLLRSAFLGKYKKIKGSQPKQEQEAEERGGDGGSQPEQEQQADNGKHSHNWQSFRHIKELKAAGIYLRPSGTSCITNICFSSYFFYGYLNLPPIIIDDSTKPKFLIILAYEMSPDAPDDYVVTSYICFLDNLIDHEDDVKELRSKHILYNLLGSDEDVAKIFNEISNDLVDRKAYKDVEAGIQKHYDNRVNTWIALVFHNHFGTPWTITAFIAAVLILFLTGLQTYYAVPSKSRLLLYIFVPVMCVFPCLVFMIRKIKK